VQFLPDHVEISSAELEIGLQMVSLGPLVPRFHEQETFLGRTTVRDGYAPPYLSPEEFGGRAVKNKSVPPASRCVVPVREEARMTLDARSTWRRDLGFSVFVADDRR